MTTATAAAPVRAATIVPAVLFAAAGTHLVNDTMQAIMLSIYPMLRDLYALTFTQVGLITFAFQITGSLLQPFIGSYTDKHPMPYLLPIGPAFTLVGFLLLGLAGSFHAMLIAACCIGIGSAIFHPDASRVSRMASGGRFGMAQSLFQVGGNVGTAMGPLLAAIFIIPHGQGSILWFALLALISIFILFNVGRWHSGHLQDARAAGPRPAPKPVNMRKVLPPMAILLALMFSKFVYMSSMHSFYSFYLIDHFGITTQQAQIWVFLLLGAVAVGTFAGGPIGDRIGRKTVIWFSIVGTLPFALALPYANLFWTIALTVPIGLILSSAFPAMVVYAQELMPGRVGMISGMFFGFAFGLGGIGAAVLGRIADHTSIDFVFRMCSYLPLLGLLAFFLPSREDLQKSQH